MLRSDLLKLFASATVAVMVTAAALASDEGLRPGADYPAMSPDGTKIVFTANLDGSRDLWLSDATGANLVRLTPWADSDENQPAWAPDGSRIAFSSTRGSPKHNIWVIKPDGSDAQQLTSDDADHFQPRYSPLGSPILYLSNATGWKELWVMNADGSEQRSIALISLHVSNPAWSPDGQQIVYVGCRRGAACNLFRISADGSSGLQITSGEFQDWNPDWGTTGIIFASNRGAHQGLWLVQSDGSGLLQVTAPDGAADLYPRWGAGSAFVFSRSGDIWSVASLGGAAERITRLSSVLTALSAATIWIGLTNSDDVGIRFDLAAKVYLNGVEVGSGQLDSVAGGSSGFDNANLNAIALSLAAPVAALPGDTLSVEFLVRNACTGSGKNTGKALLWYNGQPIDLGADRDAGSRFDATIGGSNIGYFLRGGAALSTTAGGARLSVDKPAGARCSGFKKIGTWSTTVP